jgi:hypothetical protein
VSVWRHAGAAVALAMMVTACGSTGHLSSPARIPTVGCGTRSTPLPGLQAEVNEQGGGATVCRPPTSSDHEVADGPRSRALAALLHRLHLFVPKHGQPVGNDYGSALDTDVAFTLPNQEEVDVYSGVQPAQLRPVARQRTASGIAWTRWPSGSLVAIVDKNSDPPWFEVTLQEPNGRWFSIEAQDGGTGHLPLTVAEVMTDLHVLDGHTLPTRY